MHLLNAVNLMSKVANKCFPQDFTFDKVENPLNHHEL